MKSNSKLFVFLLFVFCSFSIYSQNYIKPKKIKAKGEYIIKRTNMSFPLVIDSFQREKIYSFNEEETNIGVVYENEENDTKVTIYIYPAGNGVEGRLRNEYFNSMQEIANLSYNGINATQFAVRKEGEKYICNGFKAIIENNKKEYNSLCLYECGEWFLKVRITSYKPDTNYINYIEQKIYSKYDPTKLTELNPLNTKTTIHIAPGILNDSILLGSAMGSALKKVEWTEKNIKENEKASGVPDLYLDFHVESLKAFMEFQNRDYFNNSKKSKLAEEYLGDLQFIYDAGFLNEFIMEQYSMVMIVPQNLELRYNEYQDWKSKNKTTISLNIKFDLISYEKKNNP